MSTSRRDFLKSASLLGFGATVPTFLARTAHAAPTADRQGAKDTILVVVQLTGGNDGLNTVVPFADPEYAKLRPTLKLDKNTLHKLNDSLGLHPAMNGFSTLHQDSALCVVQGVGYPNPSQSHFRSMDIWNAGSTADDLPEGWIGKALKGMNNAPSFHIAADNESAPLALAGAPVRVPSITSLAEFQLKTAAATQSERKEQKTLIEKAATPMGGNNLLDFVQRTAVSTYASSQRLQELAKNYQPKVTYPPSALANRLLLAAQLIDADLGARIFYVSIDGFDTHANQAGGHAALLGEVSAAITAFYQDLAARGHKDRVMVMTFSEFGRRAHENGSRGTDHGSGAPMFLVGGKVKPGIVGAHPSLTKLDADNLIHSIDFRQVYAAILDQWLGVNSTTVLGKGFTPVDVLAKK